MSDPQISLIKEKVLLQPNRLVLIVILLFFLFYMYFNLFGLIILIFCLGLKMYSFYAVMIVAF